MSETMRVLVRVRSGDWVDLGAHTAMRVARSCVALGIGADPRDVLDAVRRTGSWSQGDVRIVARELRVAP